MLEGLELKIGDLVVRYGRILKITKISEGIVFLKPYFDDHTGRGLNYSLPTKNMAMIKLRRTVSRGKLNQLLKKVLKDPEEKKELVVLNMREPLENNDLKETMRVVRMLWLERRENEGSLPSGKLTVYQLALGQLVEEVAVVCGLTREKAKLKVGLTLKAIG